MCQGLNSIESTGCAIVFGFFAAGGGVELPVEKGWPLNVKVLGLPGRLSGETGKEEVGMRLSTRSRYGLRALVALAESKTPEGRCAREIADEEALSKKYLESILAQLRTAGFVRSVRGAHGGYLLARNSTELTVGEVVRALEGNMSLVECVDDLDCCERSHDCPTRPVWVKAERAISDALNGITLASLITSTQ